MNQIPLPTRDLLGSAQLDLLTRPLYVVLISTQHYTFQPEHGTIAAIPPAALLAASPPLSKKTLNGGVLRAETVVLTRAPKVEIGAFALIADGPPDGPIVYWIDEIARDPDSGMPGLPFLHHGGPLVLFPERSGIFAIS